MIIVVRYPNPATLLYGLEIFAVAVCAVSGAALATAAYSRFRTVPTYSLTMADALGLALFTVSGAKVALQDGAPFLIAVLMAATTGVAGGAIRDVLCGEIPRIFRGEIYATVSLTGATLFIAMQRSGISTALSALVATSVMIGLRVAAIHWKVRLEPFALQQKTQ
jgi:uncharacterized membrane protein YeiH